MWETLISIAAALGLSSLVDQYEANRASGKIASSNEIDLLIKTSKANSEGKYQSALDKLGAIPQLVTASPYLQGELRRSRRKAYEDSVKVRDDTNKEIALSNALQDRLYNYNSKPDSYKNSAVGKAELDAIEQSVKTGESIQAEPKVFTPKSAFDYKVQG